MKMEKPNDSDSLPYVEHVLVCFIVNTWLAQNFATGPIISSVVEICW